MQFLVLTFNHKDCILQHLESIKFQILNHSKGESCSIYIFDDASHDETLNYTTLWLDRNEKLFSDVKIAANEFNQGTVKNFTRAIESVSDDKFKLLAGDDIYYRNSIFEASAVKGVLISPVIRFSGQEVLADGLMSQIQLVLANRSGSLRKHLERTLALRNCIEAPGVFMSPSIFANGRALEMLADYTYIEDLPLWNYLINIKKDPCVSLAAVGEPYVMYRVSTGVSTSSHHPARSAYLAEEEKLQREICHQRWKAPAWRNGAVLKDVASKCRIKLVDVNLPGYAKRYYEYRNSELIKAKRFLNSISTEASREMRELSAVLHADHAQSE